MGKQRRQFRRIVRPTGRPLIRGEQPLKKGHFSGPEKEMISRILHGRAGLFFQESVFEMKKAQISELLEQIGLRIESLSGTMRMQGVKVADGGRMARAMESLRQKLQKRMEKILADEAG